MYETMLALSTGCFALVALFASMKAAALKEDLDIERGCHWLTQQALERLRKESRAAEGKGDKA